MATLLIFFYRLFRIETLKQCFDYWLDELPTTETEFLNIIFIKIVVQLAKYTLIIE